MLSHEEILTSFSSYFSNLSNSEYLGEHLQDKLFVDFILNFYKENKKSKKILVTYIFAVKTDNDDDLLKNFINAKYSHSKIEERLRLIYQFTQLGLSINFDLDVYLSFCFDQGLVKNQWYGHQEELHLYFNKYYLENFMNNLVLANQSKEEINFKYFNYFYNSLMQLDNLLSSLNQEDKKKFCDLMYKLYKVFMYKLDNISVTNENRTISELKLSFFFVLYTHLINRGFFIYNYYFLDQGSIIFNLVSNSFF